MNKLELKNFIYNNCVNHITGKWISARLSDMWLKSHGVYDDLVLLYSDSSCMHETIYRLLNDIDVRPVCKICGNNIKYAKCGGFSGWCSPKCRNNDPEVLAKNKAGVSKALKKAYEERGDEIKKKRAKTLTGDENGCCSPFALKTCQEQIKQTNIERYGVDNVFRLKEFHQTTEQYRNHRKKLWLSRGVDVDYTDTHVIVHNACSIHGDIEIPTELFHARWRRCPKNSDGNPNIEFLCRECHPLYQTGVEKVVAEILDSIDIDYIFRDRQQIKPLELDFWIPEKRLAIECNGIYWHSVDKKEEDYHLNKYTVCQENNITLLSIWEDDAFNCPNFVKALILSYALGYKKEFWDNVSLDEIKRSSACLLDNICDYIIDEYGVRLYSEDKCQYICLNDEKEIPLALNINEQIFNSDTINVDVDKLIPYEKMHQYENREISCPHIGYVNYKRS